MLASELRVAQVILLNGIYHRVIEANLHKGSAKMGAMVHAKLRNMQSGTVTEHRFATDDKIQEVEIEIKEMQFLYAQGDNLVLMDPLTYEQIELPKKAVGPATNYLTENLKVPVELDGEKPIGIVFPKVVEIKVAETGVGIRGQADSTYKPATLENGLEILVPQFIEKGDSIRVEVETGKYLERVQKPKGK